MPYDRSEMQKVLSSTRGRSSDGAIKQESREIVHSTTSRRGRRDVVSRVKLEASHPTLLSQKAKRNPSRKSTAATRRRAGGRKRSDENKHTDTGKLSKHELLAKLRNPKVKKDEMMSLDADTIISRITNAGISLDLFPTGCAKEIQDVVVRRDFMRTTYGGNGRIAFPPICRQKVLEHGYDNFMYIVPHYQPIAPEVPGAPGLWITTQDDGHHGEVRRLLTRISETPALWQYQGQYELRRVPDLTPDEWSRQTVKLRDTWSEGICTKKWGEETLARIRDRHPQFKDVVGERMKERVALSLHKGEEALAVYTMKCIDYDIAFQTELAERYPIFDMGRRRGRVMRGEDDEVKEEDDEVEEKDDKVEVKCGVKRKADDERLPGQSSKRRTMVIRGSTRKSCRKSS